MEDSNNLKINKGNKIIPSAVFELTTCLIDWVLSPFLNIYAKCTEVVLKTECYMHDIRPKNYPSVILSL